MTQQYPPSMVEIVDEELYCQVIPMVQLNFFFAPFLICPFPFGRHLFKKEGRFPVVLEVGLLSRVCHVLTVTFAARAAKSLPLEM